MTATTRRERIREQLTSSPPYDRTTQRADGVYEQDNESDPLNPWEGLARSLIVGWGNPTVLMQACQFVARSDLERRQEEADS